MAFEVEILSIDYIPKKHGSKEGDRIVGTEWPSKEIEVLQFIGDYKQVLVAEVFGLQMNRTHAEENIELGNVLAWITSDKITNVTVPFSMISSFLPLLTNKPQPDIQGRFNEFISEVAINLPEAQALDPKQPLGIIIIKKT